jgi:hypothetical protein
VYCAGVVLGATLVAAVWLYTYRVWESFITFDPQGRSIVAATRVRFQPWWSLYGAIALTLIGAGISLWLLPEGRRLIRRFVARLGAVFSAKPSY